MTEGAVRVAVHRLRRRYRELLRDEITHTLSDPAQVDEEMRAVARRFWLNSWENLFNAVCQR